MYNFPLIVKGNDILKRIFPAKQKAVAQILELLKDNEKIDRIIIFGSAVTLNCGTYSDVDVAIEADISTDEFLKVAHILYVNVDSEVDVIHYNTIRSELLKQEIDSKGVEVYVADKNK